MWIIHTHLTSEAPHRPINTLKNTLVMPTCKRWLSTQQHLNHNFHIPTSPPAPSHSIMAYTYIWSGRREDCPLRAPEQQLACCVGRVRSITSWYHVEPLEPHHPTFSPIQHILLLCYIIPMSRSSYVRLFILKATMFFAHFYETLQLCNCNHHPTHNQCTWWMATHYNIITLVYPRVWALLYCCGAWSWYCFFQHHHHHYCLVLQSTLPA